MKPLTPWILACVVTLSGIQGCGSGPTAAQKSPPALPMASTPSQSLQPGSNSTEPKLVQSAGTARAERLPDSSGEVTARVDSGAFTYLRVRIDGKEASRLESQGMFRWRCEPNPDCLGVWSVAKGDEMRKDAHVILRWPLGNAESQPTSMVY